MENELRPFWKIQFEFNWKFGLFLIFIICIPRFILVLHANATANYSYIGMVMVISALAPFIFLNKFGRRQIGLRNPQNIKWIAGAVIIGLAFSFLLFLLGKLYGESFHNWYIYIRQSYNIPPEINQKDKAILFSIMALTGMIFSPIGEEFFFRGIVHASFAKSIGEKKASLVDSTAFALTHISHFGLVFINGKWKFLLVPSLIWVSSMFLVSLLFFLCKKKTSSVWGAVICHAAFNLGMIYCIFYLL